MHEFAERAVKRHSGNKAKKESYSQLFVVSTVEAETISNSVRKFSELQCELGEALCLSITQKLQKLMNFSCESFCCLRHIIGH